ncbi:MAG TPA: hypothetical protein VH436_30895 [Vicinamibacterales bacterium]|jgi:hypothetical protein
MDRTPETEIEKAWQQQPREAARISVEEIRTRAQRFDANTRWWRSVGAAVVVIAVIAEVVQVWYGRDTVERIGDLLTIAAFFYIAYEYRKYSLSIAERLGQSCVDFYRAQLVHERTLAGQSMRYLLPFVPGVTLSLLHGVIGEGLTTPHRIGVVVVGIAVFVGVAWVNARTTRRVRREIDAIDAV